jgi:DNA-binding NtrC family response regulator
VVAATHRDLEDLVARGEFREDLYYRLRVVEIRLPALRERREDIPILAEHVLRRASTDMHGPTRAIAPDAVAKLKAYDWPGNVRELENALMRAALLARSTMITADDLLLDGRRVGTITPPKDRSLAALERAHVEHVLAEMRGNKRRAARMLGVSRSRLDRIIAKHGIEVGGPET